MNCLNQIILLLIAALLISSCSSSQSSASMRQIEKHAKKNPLGPDGLPIPTRGKAKKSMEMQQKQKQAEIKEAEKAHADGITRHRSLQTQETLDRMDRNLKETEKKYGNQKEFFVVRWFRPANSIEKIEKQQAKETQKRMAASQKKSEQTNKEYGLERGKIDKDRKTTQAPDPKNVQQGGGGVYREGASKGVKPAKTQQGGGGTYSESKSKKQKKRKRP